MPIGFRDPLQREAERRLARGPLQRHREQRRPLGVPQRYAPAHEVQTARTSSCSIERVARAEADRGPGDLKTDLDGELALEYALGIEPGPGRNGAPPNPDLIPGEQPGPSASRSGKVGLWAKTDSTSYFKDYVIVPVTARRRPCYLRFCSFVRFSLPASAELPAVASAAAAQSTQQVRYRRLGYRSERAQS